MVRIGTAGMVLAFAAGALIIIVGGVVAAFNQSFLVLGISALFAIPLVGAAVALMIGEEKAEQRLEQSRIRTWEREERLRTARAGGAEPGQLSEALPERGDGNLSIPEQHGAGALSMAKKS